MNRQLQQLQDLIQKAETLSAEEKNVLDKAFKDTERLAQVELALEKVRAKTIAMQRSAELADTASVLFQQIKGLGFDTWSCGFCIWKENDLVEVWMGADAGGLLPPMLLPYKEEPTHKKIYEAFVRGDLGHKNIWEGEELKAHYAFMQTIPSIKVALDVLADAGLSLPDRQCYNVGFFDQGYLLIITKEPDTELEQLSHRLATVFEQTYTRFLDLQKAEEQATQAELALVLLQTEKKRAEDALAELKVTQKQLIQKEKMASLGELTAGIAHEIQNPLNFVNNFSQVSMELLDELREEATAGNTEDVLAIANDLTLNLQKIDHHGKRADSIVKGMLEHSRVGTGEKQLTDLTLLADEFLKLSYHGLRSRDRTFNVEIITDLAAGLPPINVVQQDIGRVLINLFNNAFYAVQHKEKTAGRDFQPKVKVSTSSTGKSILIVVSDNGTGIPDEIKDKIMQPFFTTKPTGQGTGLGLSLSYDIVVKGHGGAINVKSEPGKYTEFEVLIPLDPGGANKVA